MPERVFNRMKRQVFRKHIPRVEMICGGAVLAFLALAVAWVAGQRDAYDPGERDIRFDVLDRQRVEDRLYKRPFKAWVEPDQAPEHAAPDLGRFPAAVLEGGWRMSTRPQQFNPENLYVKIDGAAEQYLRYGFRELSTLNLRSAEGADEIGIELYDQGTFANGLAIFSAQRDPAKQVERAAGAYFYRTTVGAIGVRGPWFFKIAGNAERPAIREKALQLVQALAALPARDGEVPFGFRLLSEKLGIPFDRIAFQPVNVFQYDFARDFWFGRPDAASPGRLFVHAAESPQAAAGLYGRLMEELLGEYETVEKGDDHALLRHPFLKSYFALGRRGSLIFGMENEPRAERLRPALARLGEAIAP